MWVSVFDLAGRPLPGISVFVNGAPCDTDSMGQASFKVPQTDRLTLCLQGDDGKPAELSEYHLTPGGFLVREKDVDTAIDQLEGSIESSEQAPMIAYAPAVVETSQPFVLLGKNLSGKPEADRIVLDGYDADIFAGSTAALLATAPRRLSAGPLRELYVTANGESSNIMEVDVCRLEFNIRQATEIEPESAAIYVIGTNVPAMVQLQNSSPDIVALEFDKKKLGARSSFISPGGENNQIRLSISHLAKGGCDIDTHLVSDAPWCSTDDRNVFGDSNFRKIVEELNRAEIVRLKRRLIAVNARIADEQAHRTQALSTGSMHAEDLDKFNAELRLLSNRQQRITMMISSRRAVFASLGGTDDDYRQALDQAAGGGIISLEKTLSPLTSVALLSSTTQPLEKTSIDDASAGQTLSAAELQVKERELAESMAALSKMWKKYPIKQARSGRLAAPPEPYIPNLGQIFPPTQAMYAQYVNPSLPPPPPILLQQMKQRTSKAMSRHKSSHKRSSKKTSGSKRSHK